MLKGIDKLLTGDMPKILCDIGHGDELVIAGANCPGNDLCTTADCLPEIGGIKVAEATRFDFSSRYL